jgi:UDP-N-acetylglucosamine 2-epimerase
MINHTDLVLVVGDFTITMTCVISGNILNTKVVHLEAGIRYNDLSMTEEINRIVTDMNIDYFLPSQLGHRVSKFILEASSI